MVKKSNWLQTYTGKMFLPFDPKPEDICIEDIAHGLSLTCRYSGQCKKFYSVAQHSCYVSDVMKTNKLWGLLHDAAEAYIGDVPRPIKRNLLLFQELEKKIMNVVIKKFGLLKKEPKEVKIADNRMLATEGRDLMYDVNVWTREEEKRDPFDFSIIPWSPKQAEIAFLKRFKDLYGG